MCWYHREYRYRSSGRVAAGVEPHQAHIDLGRRSSQFRNLGIETIPGIGNQIRRRKRNDGSLNARAGAVPPEGNDASILYSIQLDTEDVGRIHTGVGGYPAHAVVIKVAAAVGLEVHLQVDSRDFGGIPVEGTVGPDKNVGGGSEANGTCQAIPTRDNGSGTGVKPISVGSDDLSQCKAGIEGLTVAGHRNSRLPFLRNIADRERSVPSGPCGPGCR